MTDAACWQAISGLVFTLPVTLQDVEALLVHARALPWSLPAKFDVYSHDGKHVHLTITVGTNIYKKVYDGV